MATRMPIIGGFDGKASSEAPGGDGDQPWWSASLLERACRKVQVNQGHARKARLPRGHSIGEQHGSQSKASTGPPPRRTGTSPLQQVGEDVSACHGGVAHKKATSA